VDKDIWLRKQDPKIAGPHDYFIDQDGCSYDNPYEWLWTAILGGCMCGSADDLAIMAYKILEMFSNSGDDWNKRSFSVYDNIHYEIIAHWFDSVEITEHGSSVGGSWLSSKGKKIFESMKECLK
jgi:hypothetical protein